MLEVDAVVPAIIEKITDIKMRFREVPGLILTEDDLKCAVVRHLHDITEIRQCAVTADPPIMAGYIHSEISWFGDNSKLIFKPDITVTDPACLSLLHARQDGIPFPSKGAHFNGNSILIEFKFFHSKNGMTRRNCDSIKKDMEKLYGLIQRGQNLDPQVRICGLMVVFSRYHTGDIIVGYIQEQVSRFEPIQFIYGSAEMPHTNDS